MKRMFLVVCLIGMSAFLVGCGNPDITLIKDGTLPDYPTPTIGKAFKEAFDDRSWEAVKSENNDRIVKFSGKISARLHDNVLKKPRQEIESAKNPKQQFKIKSQIYVRFLSKFGGLDNQQLKTIQEKYKSSKEEKENNYLKYLDESIELFFSETWKPGTPVEVQWLITPDGKSYSIKSMSSNSWEGENNKVILDAIYGK